MIKKHTTIFLFVSILLTFLILPSNSFASDNIDIFINGQKLKLNNLPIIENGVTMVPMRQLFESLGAYIHWDEDYEAVIAAKETPFHDVNIALAIDYPKAYVQRDTFPEEWIELDIPPKIINGSTYIPLRFVSESLGADVNWDEVNREISIRIEKSTQPTGVDFSADALIKKAIQGWAKGRRAAKIPIDIWLEYPAINDYFQHVTFKSTDILYGYTKRNSSLTVNGEKAKVFSDGRFEYYINLEKGANKIKLKSEDLYGHEKIMTGTIHYYPLSPAYVDYEGHNEVDASNIFDDARGTIAYIEAKLKDGNVSQGTGFIVNPKGVLVTNYHVIKDFKELYVKVFNKKYDVENIIAISEEHDLAIINLKGDNFPYLKLTNALLGSSEGEKVYAIGHPLGLQNTISEGILSSYRFGETTDVLQITTPISPGSSGGPLLNKYGHVIGVTTFKLLDGESLNFAISSKYIWETMYPDIEDWE